MPREHSKNLEENRNGKPPVNRLCFWKLLSFASIRGFKKTPVGFLTSLLFIVLFSLTAIGQPNTYPDVPGTPINFDSTTRPCSNPLVRNIFVGTSYNILDVKLGFNALHTWRGDIIVTLEHPDGTQATVINRSGGSLDNYDLELDDSGGALNDGTNDDTSFPYYDRSAAPSNPLSVFDGKDAAGTWKVNICDAASGDSGTYNRSLLTIEEDVADPSDPICGIRSDIENNWIEGSPTYTEFNIDGSGVNMTVAATGETSRLDTIRGGTFGGVSGLDVRTDGFLGSGVTFTYTFSENLASVDFDIGHINRTDPGGLGGDSFTITARDSLNNVVYPKFTTSGSSYTANESTGFVNAIAEPLGTLGVHFDDPDLIKSVVIIWNDCTSCGNSFHGMSIGEMDICVVSYDYGDAPDTNSGTSTGNYQTLSTNNGPRHTISTDLSIGTAPDGEANGFGNGFDSGGNATDDDNEDTADEGLISLGALTVGDSNYSVNNIAVNNTSTTATLYGWIDFDRNGSFDEDERATATVSPGASTANLSWSSLPGLAAGVTYARFRIAHSGHLTPGANGGADEASLGDAASGEVEDYQLTVAAPAGPDLSIDKSHIGNFSIASVGTYFFSITNSGTAATSGTITFSDTLPNNLKVNGGAAGSVSAGGTNGSDWACNSDSSTPQTVTCTSTAVIAASGGSSDFSISTNVGSGTPTGTNSITNTAYVYGGGDPSHTNLGNAASDSDPTTVDDPSSPGGGQTCQNRIGDWTLNPSSGGWQSSSPSSLNNDSDTIALHTASQSITNFAASRRITFTLRWQNGNGFNNSGNRSTMELRYNGVTYFRAVSTTYGVTGNATLTALNGASVNVTSVARITNTPIIITLPAATPASANLEIRRTIDENSDPSGAGDDWNLTNLTAAGACSDLSVTKDDGVTSLVTGTSTTYTVTVSNSGPEAVAGAILTDPAITGLTITGVSCSASPGQCTTGTTPTIAQLQAGFALPNIASGQSYSISIIGTATATSGTIVNTATIAAPSDYQDPDASNNSASDTDSIAVQPKIVLVKNCTVPADCTTVAQLPDTELTYKIDFSNTGGTGAAGLILVDAIPENTDFKIGSAAVDLGTTGLTFVIEYSNDYDPLNPTLATWTYTPVSEGGGADAGFDRLVKAIRWRVTAGSLSQTSPNNSGSVSFISKIR